MWIMVARLGREKNAVAVRSTRSGAAETAGARPPRFGQVQV